MARKIKILTAPGKITKPLRGGGGGVGGRRPRKRQGNLGAVPLKTEDPRVLQRRPKAETSCTLICTFLFLIS